MNPEILKLLATNGVIIEKCGTWFWFSGQTYPNKQALKAAGCIWHAKKQMWYWKPADEHRRFSGRHDISLDAIREKYGCERVEA